MRWWARKRRPIPQIDLEESKAMVQRARGRRQLTDRIVRQISEERIKNHFALDVANALEARRR